MHSIRIPQSVIDRVIEKRGREHIYQDMDPAKTALVVVDMQNAFMLPGVAHALCPMAENIVPAINRLAQAVRATGGTVVWIKTTFKEDALENWSTYFEMVTKENGERRIAALTSGSKGHQLWSTLDVKPDDLIVEKNRFSAFIQGSSNRTAVIERLRSIRDLPKDLPRISPSGEIRATATYRHSLSGASVMAGTYVISASAIR